VGDEEHECLGEVWGPRELVLSGAPNRSALDELWDSEKEVGCGGGHGRDCWGVLAARQLRPLSKQDIGRASRKVMEEVVAVTAQQTSSTGGLASDQRIHLAPRTPRSSKR
jgi:hypothetical protein